MRTNIVLDERLVEEAMKYAPVKTKRDLVDLALREYISNHERRDIRELKGRIAFFEGYDHEVLRERECK